MAAAHAPCSWRADSALTPHHRNTLIPRRLQGASAPSHRCTRQPISRACSLNLSLAALSRQPHPLLPQSPATKGPGYRPLPASPWMLQGSTIRPVAVSAGPHGSTPPTTAGAREDGAAKLSHEMTKKNIGRSPGQGMAVEMPPMEGGVTDAGIAVVTPMASTRRDCLLKLALGTVTVVGGGALAGAQVASPALAAPFCEVAGPVIPPWVYSAPWNEDFLPNQVWYREVGDKRKAEKAGRLPVLVVHGGPGLPHSYLEPLELLSIDRCVYFYDQSGCGFSGSDEPRHFIPQGKGKSSKKKQLPKSFKPADREPEPEVAPEVPAGLTVKAFAQELADVRAVLGLKEVHIVAHGWGAVLALEHALSPAGTGIASLTLSSALPSYAALISERRKRLASLPPDVSRILADADDDPSLRSTPAYGAADTAYQTAFFCRTLQGSTKLECLVQAEQSRGGDVFNALCGGKRFQEAGDLKGWDVGPRLQELNIPTLVTCGDSDEISEGAARNFSAQISNAQLAVFERSGSCSHIDAGQAYLESLSQFLSARDAKRA
eukprot:jgi/Mesvir1/7917/Mv11842-RA.1